MEKNEQSQFFMPILLPGTPANAFFPGRQKRDKHTQEGQQPEVHTEPLGSVVRDTAFVKMGPCYLKVS